MYMIDMEDQIINFLIYRMSKFYYYINIVGYKYWQRCGFTDKSRIVAGMVSDIYQIPITMAEIFNQ